MVRLSRTLTSLCVVLLLLLGLAPGGARPAAGHALPPALSAAAQSVHYVGHAGGWTQGAAVQGHLAYTGEGPRLMVLDVSTPGSPTVLGKTVPLPGLVNNVALTGNYAYVSNGWGGLQVVDVSTPATPTVVGSFAMPEYVYDVAVQGGNDRLVDPLGPRDVREVTRVAVTLRWRTGRQIGPGTEATAISGKHGRAEF